MSSSITKLFKNKKNSRTNLHIEKLRNLDDNDNENDNQSLSDSIENMDNYMSKYNLTDNIEDDTKRTSLCSNESLVAKNVEIFSNQKIEKKIVKQICEMCNKSDNSNMVILSCNHIYHVKCLADEHHKQAKKYSLLDNTFFNNIKCNCCNTMIETSEMQLIHSKFYKNTKDLLMNHNKEIEKLDHQINKIKEELKISMDYKQKLEYEREKSKQIIVMLNNEIL